MRKGVLEMQTSSAVYIDDIKGEKEPELLQIINSLKEVTGRLESAGVELMAFEPKISMNGNQPQPTSEATVSTEDYSGQLRNILRRLRALDEEKLTPAVNMFRAFL